MHKLLTPKNRPVIAKILGRFFLTIVGTISVYLNQQNILRIAKTQKSLVLQVTPHLGTGVNIENYYHFIFDLVLPIYALINQTNSDVVFTVKLDNFAKKLKILFPNRVKIENKKSRDLDNAFKVNLLGMNAKVVYLKKTFLEKFKQDIFLGLEISSSQSPQKILLIERGKPNQKVSNSDSNQSSIGGVLRRSIVNHNELYLMIKSMIKAPFELHNLQLETLSLKEQIEYFDRAAVVIAQHGAGLTNCLWMRANTVLIELNHHDSLRHFRYISHQKNLNYFMYKTSEAQATIDVHDFSLWLSNNPQLKDFFTKSQS